MSLEDTAEKARRNLMIVSSGIFAVWALGIPLDGKLVGAVDLSAVEPWRAWVAATCVLVYFAARHFFAPATAKEWAPWRIRRKKDVDASLLRIFSDALSQIPEASAGQIDVRWNDMRSAKLKYSLITLPTNRGRSGEFSYRWDYATMASRAVATAEERIQYPTEVQQGHFTYSRSTYFKCHWRAFRKAYKLSWELLELSFPWFLAFGALIICLCKLAASLYYSFPFVRQLLSA